MPLAALDAMRRRHQPVTCASVAVAAFLIGGIAALPAIFRPFVEKLTEGPVPVALVALGNPYLLPRFPEGRRPIWRRSAPRVPSEISAVKALFGEIPITGHTAGHDSPVSRRYCGDGDPVCTAVTG